MNLKDLKIDANRLLSANLFASLGFAKKAVIAVVKPFNKLMSCCCFVLSITTVCGLQHSDTKPGGGHELLWQL